MAHVSHRKNDVYLLRMPHEIGEGCKVIMTRALSRVKNEKLKKLTDVRLWEFAGLLNILNLRFTRAMGSQYAHKLGFYLQLFSRFDHPVAKLVIMGALPLVIQSQNEDGSWGKEHVRDATTRAVVRGMMSLGKLVPSHFLT